MVLEEISCTWQSVHGRVQSNLIARIIGAYEIFGYSGFRQGTDNFIICHQEGLDYALTYSENEAR